MPKRVVVISDLHCGHRVGLTPPKFQSAIPGDKYHRIQIELWDQYSKWMKELQPIDILVVNGDAIDGKGNRSGSTELLTTSPFQQCEIAIEAISEAKAKNHVFLYGTPYHTGIDDDYEKQIADKFDTDIHGHEWIDVNGTVFDLKHKVGSSTIPHGRATPVSKERLWNLIWTEHEEQPKAQVFIRSHVHYFNYVGEDNWLGMTTPALQGQGSKFGSRQCSGTVHFGLVYFDCYKEGYTWGRKILRATAQKRSAKKF